ncbi:MAG: leucine-rich repeat domain-containing protein, partial [Candidatus Sigynarchaeota archaeon]
LSNVPICRLDEIEGLDEFPRLDILRLDNTGLESLAGLDEMPWASGLKELHAMQNRLVQIEGLSCCASIERLFIGDYIEEIKGLENCLLLKELQISGNITKIQNLSLPKLEILDLSNNYILKLEFPEVLVNLRMLYLHNNSIPRIENLDGLQSLQYIDLSNNQIRRIENLDRLDQLQQIILINNPIEGTDRLFKLVKENPLNVEDALNPAVARAHYIQLFKLSGIDISPHVLKRMENVEGKETLDIELIDYLKL